jgi:hypothetical protein
MFPSSDSRFWISWRACGVYFVMRWWLGSDVALTVETTFVSS